MFRKTFPLYSKLIIAICGILWARVGVAQTTAIYMDPSQPIAKRVDDLVHRMTLEEKVSQMQNQAVAIPRLNVPAYNWWTEGLHGVAWSGYATMFPQAIGLAATWDVPLMHTVAATISTEARAKNAEALRNANHGLYYGLSIWSPNINIFRDPRWGRGQETYGEDPFLTSRMGVAFVEGLQGDDPHYYKTIATPKHYVVHSGPESTRHIANVDVSPHDLEDTYLPAFRATVTEGKAGSVMCAYNAIDGQPACANTYLLLGVLRNSWGFKGYVTSDCGAITDVMVGHKFAPDLEHASALSVKAGTDTSCEPEYASLTKAVHDGLISETEIDKSVKRLFTARFELGQFDPVAKVAYARIPFTEDDSVAHRKLARIAAEKAMVLLKNDGILPLKKDVKTIAVIGPNAASLAAIEGNYNAIPSHPILPLDGIEARFRGQIRILYAQGSPYVRELTVPVPRTLLRPAGGSAEFGLKAEYFDNVELTGKPLVTRVDQQVAFDWDAASPVPEVQASAFGVRWTGTITPPVPGKYQFSFWLAHCYSCGDEKTLRVFLDRKQVMGYPVVAKEHSPGTQPFVLDLSDGKPHALKIEYSHNARLSGAGLSFNWMPPVDVERAEAVKVANKADVVVAFVGLSPLLEGEEMPVHVEGFNGGDRTRIELPTVQKQMLEAVAATGKPIIVVLMSGSALAVNWANDHAAAILEAWYPGEEGGTAIADTLAGDNNPAGRLPVTFYASTEQLPPFDDYSMAKRTYRYFTASPLWEFGYGLSYSKFRWSNVKLSTERLRAGEPLALDVNVENMSTRKGDAVSEVYLQTPPSATAPIRTLVGFARTPLDGHQRRLVHLVIDPRSLGTVSATGVRSINAGEYSIFVGGQQPGKAAGGVTQRFTIVGTKALPQ